MSGTEFGKDVRITNSSLKSALEELKGLRKNILDDNELLERVKKDPIGELNKLGIEIDENSVVGKKLINCASNLTPQRMQIASGCLIIPSNPERHDCFIISLPPDVEE